jgi:4-hydroxy-tetrahydrodipicolinate reductase
MIKIGVIGASGRMGNYILNLLKNDPTNIKITAAIDSSNNKLIGQKVFSDDELVYSNKIENCVENTDVFIDFTIPNATIENLEIIQKHKKNIVIGTTGFNENQINIIKNFSNNTAIVFSPNMSIGVNVFFKVVEQTAKLLKDYDVEIVEFHHNKKKDSPSGTAVKIAEIITNSTERNKENWVFGREGTTLIRNNEEIGIHSVRLGDIVGEHSVYFCKNNERIELTHKAHTRENFASGAIKAAKWLANKKTGLYNMFDVLGLKNDIC